MAEQQKPSQQEIDDVRSRTKSLIDRAKTDQGFRDQLNNDPVATLKKEGLPDQAIGEFMKGTGKDEVQGHDYIYYEEVCVYYTTYIEWEAVVF